MSRRVRSTLAPVVCAVGLALLGGCGPSWPADPARYRPDSADGAAVVATGVAAQRYRDVFAAAGDCPEVFALDRPAPGGGDLPAAIVAVCRVDGADDEQAVRDVVVRAADTVTGVTAAGQDMEAVRSPLPGAGIDLEIRIWRPVDVVVVVVIAFGDAGVADRVAEAVVGAGEQEV